MSPDPSPELQSDETARVLDARARLEARRADRVEEPAPETAAERFARCEAILAAVADGAPVGEAERRWADRYRDHPEYRSAKARAGKSKIVEIGRK